MMMEDAGSDCATAVDAEHELTQEQHVEGPSGLLTSRPTNERLLGLDIQVARTRWQLLAARRRTGP